MQGYFDAIVDGHALGWAEDEVGVVTDVAVMLGEDRIGTGRADRPRPDVGRDVGFRVALERTVSAADFLDGRAWVEATGGDGNSLRLPLASPAGLVEVVLATHLRSMSGVQLREMVGRALIGRGQADLAPALHPDADRNAVSDFGLPVGTLSPDTEVIVGHGGHLFLVTGSNGLLDQYRPSPDADAVADRWLALFERRQDALRTRGIEYLQLVLPEKASVLSKLLPFKVEPPTSLYRALAARIASSPVKAYVPDLFDDFIAHPARDYLFRRLDTHMSAAGAHYLCSLLLRRWGATVATPDFSRPVRFADGDLAHHFPWIRFVEDDLLPPEDWIDALPRPECVASHQPVRHLGTRLVFRNPGAPIGICVVAFANSFFTVGDAIQQLSWWMKHYFVEYHFIWSDQLDLAYVDQVRPDLVITQTIERFLTRVPSA